MSVSSTSCTITSSAKSTPAMPWNVPSTQIGAATLITGSMSM